MEDALLVVQNHLPIDNLLVLCHGNEQGKLVFWNDEKELIFVDPTSFYSRIPIRGNENGFKTQVHTQCFNHADVLDLDDRMFLFSLIFVLSSSGIINYHFRTTQIKTTSQEIEVTYNIPRKIVDGIEGYIHTALNPEVLGLDAVQKYLLCLK